jgi:hypothetical protein
MTNRGADKSLRKAALVAGLGLLIMTIFAVGAIYFSFPRLIVAGDAAATANNIITDGFLFRVGIGSLVIVMVCDVVVAWALYIFLEPVDRNLSLLTAWFRLVYSMILGVALFNYVDVLRLLSGADYLKMVEKDQLHAQVMLSLNAVDDEWAIGLVFFGIHLALLGYLVLKSHYVPRILGVVIIVAGFAYLIDNLGMVLIPDYDFGIATFLGWGELLFMLWLLFRGVRVQQF